jgi:hypothetical protein
MGNLRPLGTPFLGTLTTFAKAYPEVQSAIVRFTESEFGSNPKDKIHDLFHDSRVACGNPRCQRGGYDFRFQVEQMIGSKIEEEPVSVSCGGDEGSPAGRKRGRTCDMAMSGTIQIKYKQTVTDQLRKSDE